MQVIDNIICYSQAGGIGDQLSDFIGALAISSITNTPLHWHWKTIKQNHWFHGDLLYSHDLFDLSQLRLLRLYFDTEPPQNVVYPCIALKFKNPSASSSPYKVKQMLDACIMSISLSDLVDVYKNQASLIRPAPVLLDYLIPHDQNVIGVHLRCTDKVIENPTDSVFTHANDFNYIQQRLVLDINAELSQTNQVKIFVCSEDNNAKVGFKNYFESMFGSAIEFIEPRDIPKDLADKYYGVSAVRDMFCLSRCKKIIQSVNYSTFSLVASYIGNVELVNYAVGILPTLQYGWIVDQHPLTEESFKPWADPEFIICYNESFVPRPIA